MATFTANYNLRKPAGGDLVTVAADINASMDIIDGELDDHEDRLDVLEADLGVLGQTVYILKSADESVSGTSNQNDNDLFRSLPVGTHIVEFVLFVEGADAGDITVALNWTGTMTVTSNFWGLASVSTSLGPEQIRTVTSYADNTSPTNSTVLATVTGQQLTHRGVAVVVVAVTGTLRLEWSKNDSAGIDSVIKGGSFMKVTQVA